MWFSARSSQRPRALFAILVTVAMLLSTVPTANAADPLAGADLTKLEPAIVLAVRADPSGSFRTIVQRTPARNQADFRARQAELENELKSAGGRMYGRLGIVDGHAATLSASAIKRLSVHPHVRSISLDHAVSLQQVTIQPVLQSLETITANAPQVWSSYGNEGRGVTVAVLDSGVKPSADLPGAIFGVDVVSRTTTLGDLGGHGSHVAGIIAGSGSLSGGAYKGVAPAAQVLSVRVTSDDGHAAYSSVIAGLQWVVSNARTYNIRVANLSLGATPTTGYADDPLNAAAEIAWFRGIVVVASAGNSGPGPGTISVPGNDPYVVTVGAYDDSLTAATADDVLPDWSARGPTAFDGAQKPDLSASGRRVISLRSLGSYLDQTMPDRVVGVDYFRLSGTSMAAPVVAGVAALILSANPSLTPDQVKYVLKQTARSLPYDSNSVGVGAVDALAAVQLVRQGASLNRSNRGLTPNKKTAANTWPVIKTIAPVWRNKGFWQGRYWVDGTWDGTRFRAADGTWDDTAWDATAWSNFAWEEVAWSSASWDALAWADGTWDTVGVTVGSWETASRPSSVGD